MTQEEKQLLLKDLCARLPYGIIIAEFDKYDNQIKEFKLKMIGDCGYLEYDACCDGEQSASLYSKVTRNYCKPYLRPMSSMTEEEKEEFESLVFTHDFGNGLFPIEHVIMYWDSFEEVLDWLNEHHFDYRGLIPMGLALEAPEGMYKTE